MKLIITNVEIQRLKSNEEDIKKLIKTLKVENKEYESLL